MAELRDMRCVRWKLDCDGLRCQERPLYTLVDRDGERRGNYCAEHAKRRLELLQRHEDDPQVAFGVLEQLLN